MNVKKVNDIPKPKKQEKNVPVVNPVIVIRKDDELLTEKNDIAPKD